MLVLKVTNLFQDNNTNLDEWPFKITDITENLCRHNIHAEEVREETKEDSVTRTNCHFLPEGSLQDLACGDFLGAVVIPIEDISKCGLIGWDPGCLATVHSLSAGFRQRQTCAAICPTLIILNAAAGVVLAFIFLFQNYVLQVSVKNVEAHLQQ